MNTFIILFAVAVFLPLAFSRKLRGSSQWRATLTPLASIMGSGFLVCAPLIGGIAGPLSLLFMVALLVMAYCVGEAIRYNIRYFEPVEHRKHGAAQKLAWVSRATLSVAYFISIAYYLQLLAAFILHLFGIDHALAAKAISGGMLLSISLVGFTLGLDSLERVEKYAVSLNLAMIAALLASLAVHNLSLWNGGEWRLPAGSGAFEWSDARVLLGLLIVVQGFETSRYLGDKHSADERILTMRRAQWISSAIYVMFIALMTVLFEPNMSAEVTEVIHLTAPIAAVLPALLTIAAVGSQFSAAVADDAGAGGLLEDLANIPPKWAYAVILCVSTALIWLTSVTEIIAIASRAFAFFYFLQCLVAALMAGRQGGRGRVLFFAATAAVCLLVVVFGIPAE